jgi:SET domain-containing protein
MALLEKDLVVKRSSIKGSGNGLFTKRFISKGTTIVEYKGKLSSWKEANHDEGKNAYIFYVNRNHAIDAGPYKKSLARFANDAVGFNRSKGLRNNSRYITVGKRAYIEAVKDIPAGSEIFVSYGKDYWNVLRNNLEPEKIK